MNFLPPASEIENFSELRAIWRKNSTTYEYGFSSQSITQYNSNKILAALDDAQNQKAPFFFGLTYEAGKFFEKVSTHTHSSLGFVFTPERTKEHSLSSLQPPIVPRFSEQSFLAEKEYSNQFEKIRSLIFHGEVYQINYTFPIRYKTKSHLSKEEQYEFFRAVVAKSNPTHAALFFLSDTESIISASPETFFTIENSQICCSPIKGTVPIHAGESFEQVQTRLCTEKNQAELAMIVDLIRNDLHRVAKPGSVKITDAERIDTLPYVHHLVTDVSATLTTKQLSKILPALFPSASITGAPKIAAMNQIHALESEARGWYTGTLGYHQSNICTASVAIRTAQFANSTLRLDVGSGVTYDSTAVDEYQECLQKAQWSTLR